MMQAGIIIITTNVGVKVSQRKSSFLKSECALKKRTFGQARMELGPNVPQEGVGENSHLVGMAEMHC